MNLKHGLITLAAISTLGVAGASSFPIQIQADGIDRVTGGQQGIPRMDVVDVSSHNGHLSTRDFEIMRDNGVRGVIVKLTEGTYYRNPYASEQVNNARSAGLKVSGYHYSTYSNQWEATAEANYFADYAYQLGFSQDSLLVDDLEDGYTKNSGVSGNSGTFNAQIKNRGFWNTALYTYTSYKNEMNLNTWYLGDKRLWIASYPYHPSSSNLWNTQFGMWQWSSNAGFWGINGTFDVSIDYTGLATDDPKVLKKIDGKWYLIDLKNNQKLKGWQNYNGQTYFFDNNGAALEGDQTIDNHKFYFDPTKSGAMYKGYRSVDGGIVYYDSYWGTQRFGDFTIDGHQQYFDPKTGLQFKGYRNVTDGTLYYDNLGNMVHGFYDEGGHRFYYDPKTGLMHKGLLTVNGDTYYFQPYWGTMVFGDQLEINGKKYEFDSKTGKAYKGFKNVEGGTVYYGDDRAMAYGFQNNGPHRFYFDPKTGLMHKGLLELNGEKYYFQTYWGTLVTDQQVEINGKTYYFDANTGKALKGYHDTKEGTRFYDSDATLTHGFFDQGGHRFYADPKTGLLKKGWQTIDGQTYHFDERWATMNFGFNAISNQRFYFDPTTGVMHKGLLKLNGDTYYFQSYWGTLVYGQKVTVDGVTYDLDWNTGKAKKDYYQDSDEGTRYYGSDGQMVRGFFDQGGHRFYADPNTGLLKKGWQTIDGQTYHFDERWATMNFGFNAISNQRFYFDPTTGVMHKGLLKLNGDTYYFQSYWGTLVYGQKLTIDGNTYDFDWDTGKAHKGYKDYSDGTAYYGEDGAMVHGFYDEGGHRFYYDEQTGLMHKGWLTLDGKTYYFNPRWGTLVYGDTEINGKSYHFDWKDGHLTN